LQRITFAAAAPAATEQTATESVQPSDLDRALAQGDRELALQDIPAATATFEQVLAKYPDDARALYGLAIASVLSGKAERARELFEKFVAAPASTDSVSNTAWAHVYLGRIHDLKRERELAVNEYRAALAVQGAPEAARAAAQHGADAAYQPPEGPRGSK
jgi:tetratricopeptide (TPR) repeat protein